MTDDLLELGEAILLADVTRAELHRRRSKNSVYLLFDVDANRERRGEKAPCGSGVPTFNGSPVRVSTGAKGVGLRVSQSAPPRAATVTPAADAAIGTAGLRNRSTGSFDASKERPTTRQATPLLPASLDGRFGQSRSSATSTAMASL